MPFAAGSATDQLARAIGKAVTDAYQAGSRRRQQARRHGFIGAEVVAKARPDGYTVFITTNTTHAANEHLFKKLPYDPVKDFAPLTALGKGGQIMVVNPTLPGERRRRVHRAGEDKAGQVLASAAAARPAASQASCSSRWRASSILHVPYKSNPLADHRPAGGQIDMMITDMATGCRRSRPAS